MPKKTKTLEVAVVNTNIPDYWDKAKKFLIKNDPVLARIIKQYKGEALASRGSAFFSLARAIVGQQISVKAAQTVWNRLLMAVSEVLPQNILHADTDLLRTCGLSARKVIYLKELSQFFATTNPEWHLKNDQEVIKDLVSIKGIGKWSAEMFLIFHLLRPDVFPVADIGVQRAIEKHYNHGKKMPLSEMTTLSEKWKPYRTVATWYLWRSLDPVPVEY